MFSDPSDAIINSCFTDVIVPSPEIANNPAINNFALDFDGVDDVVTVNQTIGSFKTIEFWMYTENGINGSEEFDYLFSFNDSNLKYIGTGNFSGAYTNETLTMVTNFGEIMTTFAQIPPGWNHIAITGNGTSFNQIIINGDSKPVVNNGFPQVFEATTTYLGQFPSAVSSRFDGRLDEVRFWNTPRTAQQIADNYNSIIDASNSDLLAYYDFEDGPGSSFLTDRTATGANGTLNNMDEVSDWVTSETPTESVALINDFNGTQNASDTYPLGQTIVTWTATDAFGNQSTLAQTINAGDTEGPELTCGADINLDFCQETIVEIVPPTVTDNCNDGLALDFDGVNDLVSVSNFPFLTDFTLEAWVNPSYIPNEGYRSIVSKGAVFDANTNYDFGIRRNWQNGNYTMYLYIQSSTTISGYAIEINDQANTWTHLAASFDDATKTVKLYQDGQILGSSVLSVSPTDGGQDLRIGHPASTDGQDEPFTGQIDEVRIWNRVLSETEIANSHSYILSGSEPGLEGYFNFEDGTGSSTLTDQSGNGHNGSLTNMDVNTDWLQSLAPIVMVSRINNITGTADASGLYPIGQTDIIWTATDASGNSSNCTQTVIIQDSLVPEIECAEDIVVNNDPGECTANIVVPQPVASDNCTNDFALDFDGVDDYVSLNGSITIPDSFTIEAWVYPTSLTGNYSILTECNDPNSTCGGQDYKGLFFRILDGKLNLSMFDNDAGFRGFAYTSSTNLTINTWTHVVAVVNSVTKNITMYYDGNIQSGSFVFNSGSGGFSDSYTPHVGAQRTTFDGGASGFWSGKLDEIRVWDSLLSQTEIQDRSESSLSGNEPGLLAYYDFEDGPGSTTATDRAGSAVDGTLTNMDANTDWEQGPDVFEELILTNDFNGTSDASGIYPVGDTTVVWTVTDAFGNSNTCNQIITVTGEASCGITYTFDNGVWSPSDPNGVAIALDDIVVLNGDAVLNTDLTVNSVTVSPGAGLTINSGFTITSTNGLFLESNSTSYSSLILDGTVVGNLSYERHVNINGTGTTGSNDLVSAPLTGQAFSDLASTNPNIFNNGTLYLFGPFEKTTGQYINWTGTETATLNAGIGYRAATSDNSTVIFTGNAENGTVTNNIENSGPIRQEWNLVGNPYPSYLKVNDFLNHDVGGVTNIQLFDVPTAAIYGYNGNAQNGWTVYNLANTTAATLIAPGQGFFVSANAINTGLYDLEFTPAMRSTGSSDDFVLGRNTQLTYLKLNLSSNGESTRTEFYFNDNATQGLDVGYDAEAFDDINLYSHLLQDNEGKAIALQTLNSTDLSEVSIPLGVNANQGEQITFSISESTLPESVHVYLDDVVANTSTLLNTGDYISTPTTNLSGTGRFFLRTSEDALSTTNNSLDALNIFALNTSKELVVIGQLKEATIVELFDIQGRKVLSTVLDISVLENRIDVSNISGGVYMVNVQNNAQQKTQKIVLK